MSKTQEEVVEAARIRKMKWRHANPEKVLAQGRAWEAANKDKVRAKTKRRYQRTREKQLEEARLKRLIHGEEVRASRRAYYAANKEKILERCRLWRESNKESVKESARVSRKKRREQRTVDQRRRTARKHAASGSHTKSEFRALCESYEGCCAYCGINYGEKLQAEHVLALRHGGSDDINNIVPSCLRCNVRKGLKTVEDFIHFENERGRGVNSDADSFWRKRSSLMPWLVENVR